MHRYKCAQRGDCVVTDGDSEDEALRQHWTVLPLAFGAWGLALIMTTTWAAVLHYKILLEDAALASRRDVAKN